MELSLAFRVHPDFDPIPMARVYRCALLDTETCRDVVELASEIGMSQATQSADPGLNRVFRVPVNGLSDRAVHSRLRLLEHAFRIHAGACELAEEAYGVAIAPPPKWKTLPKATPKERLLANVSEWNTRVKFNMNVLKYTTEGANVGTTLHRDESPLAYVIPLRRSNANGGGTEYAHLPNQAGGVVLNPVAGTIVLHPGDAAHQGVAISARSEDSPGERWILAGFLDTKAHHRPPRPEPPIGTRRGDVEALSKRWGFEDEVEPGCHVDRSGRAWYRKRDGQRSPLRLGKSGRAVYVDTTSRAGRSYRYYVTSSCRKKRLRSKAVGALR